MEVGFSVLHFHVFVMYAPSVDAYRGTGLHPSVLDAVGGDGFGESVGCGFCHTSACEDDTFGPEGDVEQGGESGYFSVFDDKFAHGVLPDMQIGCIFEHFAPCPDKLVAVTLCARAPHGGAFRAVEYAELDGGTVGHQSHVAAQGVYFSYDLSFGNAAYGGVTAHLPDFVHVHRDKAGL